MQYSMRFDKAGFGLVKPPFRARFIEVIRLSHHLLHVDVVIGVDVGNWNHQETTVFTENV